MFTNDLLYGIDGIDSSVFPKDLIVDNALLECSNDLGTKSTKKMKRKSIACNIQENKDEGTNECKNKKIMHRDIERQRRQEMAGLYASLRSLLPLEFVKGKRSISDHMHEAVCYIKHLETNISELRNRRDKLRKSSESVGSGNGSSNIVNTPISITVNSCADARVEILINCGYIEKQVFPLSKAIALLLESGLSVLSWIATKANERVLYTIQSQVADLAYIDLPLLQQRLVNMINISTCFWVIDQIK